MKNKKKIGIALSGGGVRGIAHLGILQGLNEEGIFPDYLSGSSAGAIVAALYAHGYPPRTIFELLPKPIISSSLNLLLVLKPC